MPNDIEEAFNSQMVDLSKGGRYKHCIMEDELVIHLEMEVGDTINVLQGVTPSSIGFLPRILIHI